MTVKNKKDFFRKRKVPGYSNLNTLELNELFKSMKVKFGKKRKKTVRKSKTVGKPVRKKTVHKKTVHKKKTVRRAR